MWVGRLGRGLDFGAVDDGDGHDAALRFSTVAFRDDAVPTKTLANLHSNDPLNHTERIVLGIPAQYATSVP